MTALEKLIQSSGGYSLPFLLHLYTKDRKVDLYLVNDTKDVSYGGKTYKAAAFTYTPNVPTAGLDGGGNLSIFSQEQNLVIPLADTYSEVFLDTVGAINEKGTVTPLEFHSHHYATFSAQGSKATFNFEKDDRLSMNFPALIWNRMNNRGNS